MNAEMTTGGNGQIMTYVRPALMERPAMRLLPARETVASAVERFRRAPEGPDGLDVAAQLQREMAAKFNYLAIGRGGRAEIVEGTTRLTDIAMEKEVRTPGGLAKIRAAAIYVQSYMPVGR